jgi:hypothetical protein
LEVKAYLIASWALSDKKDEIAEQSPVHTCVCRIYETLPAILVRASEVRGLHDISAGQGQHNFSYNIQCSSNPHLIGHTTV